jgi:predicted nucleotidyltransferase
MVRVAHAAMLRTQDGPLRAVWSLAHRAAIRAIICYLRRGEPGISAYVGGSFGFGEPIYGLSDLDLALVVPEGPRAVRTRRRLERRRASLIRALGPLGEAMLDIAVVGREEIRTAASNPFVYGLGSADGGGGEDRAAYLAASGPHMQLAERPGIHRPLARWRRIDGPEVRIPIPLPATKDRRVAVWLELQWWWRYAFRVCVDPDRPRSAHLTLKLVSEPLRAWIWLSEREEVPGRREVLERGLGALPEEEKAIRWALALEEALGRAPEPPVADALGHLVRLSGRIADRLVGDANAAGATEVRLAGVDGESVVPPTALGGARELGTVAPMPLADWRAIATPRLPDEGFVVVEGDPRDPQAVAAAARAERDGILPVLRCGNLHVMPTLDLPGQGWLRALQCPPTDPVTFALAEGRTAAHFPALPGWSADDVSRRAVAEHRAWLRLPAAPRRTFLALGDTPDRVVHLARLMTAARAGLFRESVVAGEPELRLTVSATAEALGSRDEGESAVAEEGLAAYAAWRREGALPERTIVAALHKAVAAMPSYAEATGRVR